MTTAAADHSPIIRASGEGDRRWFYGGGVHTRHVRADEVGGGFMLFAGERPDGGGGVFMLFEDEMAHGKMTPLHTHPDSDETMYVLEGEILMHMDGVEHRIGVGGSAVAPRGVPHPLPGHSPGARRAVL